MVDINKNAWHERGCVVDRGRSGLAKPRVLFQKRWRRNGATKTWKTRPNEFRIPIKWGLRTGWYLTQSNQEMFHDADTCPADLEVAEYWANEPA